jgi:hypothetical protein
MTAIAEGLLLRFSTSTEGGNRFFFDEIALDVNYHLLCCHTKRSVFLDLNMHYFVFCIHRLVLSDFYECKIVILTLFPIRHRFMLPVLPKFFLIISFLLWLVFLLVESFDRPDRLALYSAIHYMTNIRPHSGAELSAAVSVPYSYHY